MFGADTSLVFDALQMVGIAVAVTSGAVWIVMRRRKSGQDAGTGKDTGTGTGKDRGIGTPAPGRNGSAAGDLEQRVRVLERIATDRSADLAEEIEALRKPTAVKTKQFEGSDQ